MSVLAIDQGTSSTKALVVGDDRRSSSEAEVAVHPVAGDDGSVEIDPEAAVALGGRSRTRRARADGSSRRARHRGRPREPGRDRAGVGPGHRAAALARARLAGPARGVGVRAPGRRRLGTAAHRDHRARARPVLRRAQARLAARARHHGRSRRDDRHLAPAPPDRRDRSPTRRPRRGRCCSISTRARGRRRRAARSRSTPRHCRPSSIAPDRSARPTRSARRSRSPVVAVDQQAALFAESCFTAGDVKCTYGTGAFLLANTGATARRSHNGLVACIAWRLDGANTYCLDGQVYTVGAAVGWLEAIGLIAEPADLDRVGGSVASAAGAVFVPGPRGVGRAVLGTAREGRVHRAHARDDAGPPRSGGRRRHRRAGRLARARRRGGSRRSAHAVAGRRRAHPLAHAAAAPGRPRAGSGRGLSVAARHRARRRGPGPVGRGRRNLAGSRRRVVVAHRGLRTLDRSRRGRRAPHLVAEAAEATLGLRGAP